MLVVFFGRGVGAFFRGDRFVPGERFAFLREQLGDAFVAVELDDDAANPDGAGAGFTAVFTLANTTGLELDTLVTSGNVQLTAPES